MRKKKGNVACGSFLSNCSLSEYIVIAAHVRNRGRSPASSRFTPVHAAPLGLWGICVSRGLYTCRPSGAKYLTLSNSINMSPRWGFGAFAYPDCYKHAAPLGLRGICVSRGLYTCRPSGAKYLTLSNSINMSPRWGFGVFAYPDCYKHAAPLGLWGICVS